MMNSDQSTQALFDALASKQGTSAQVVRQLIQDGASLSAVDSTGMTPLIRYLIDRGVLWPDAWNAYRSCLKSWDLDGRARAEIEALLARVRRCDWEIVKTMLSSGADANAAWDSDSALHIAVHLPPDPREVGLLLAAGADIAVRDRSGSTPLLRAMQSGNPDVVGLLLAAGSDLRATNSAGETALHLAWQPHTIRLLIEAGADANARDGNGFSPLSSSLPDRCAESIQLLISAGSDPLAVGAFDRTALHCAAIEAAPRDVFEALVQGKVDVSAKETAEGLTALDIVRRMRDSYESPEEHANVMSVLEHASRG